MSTPEGHALCLLLEHPSLLHRSISVQKTVSFCTQVRTKHGRLLFLRHSDLDALPPGFRLLGAAFGFAAVAGCLLW